MYPCDGSAAYSAIRNVVTMQCFKEPFLTGYKNEFCWYKFMYLG